MHSSPPAGPLHIFHLLVCQVGAQAAGRYAEQKHPLSRPVTSQHAPKMSAPLGARLSASLSRQSFFGSRKEVKALLLEAASPADCSSATSAWPVQECWAPPCR